MNTDLCIKGELGDEYEFSFPSRNHDSKNTFLKIYRKNTINIELYDDNTPFPKGIYIDIFQHNNLKKILFLHKNLLLMVELFFYYCCMVIS